jgi:pilus assembly protein CpaB
MPLRTIASLAFAIVLGLVAVLLVRGMLGSRPAGPAGPIGTMTPVVVAAAPIERGTTLTPAMLKVVSYPNSAVPTGASTSVDQVIAKNAAPRVAIRSLAANEPVLSDKLSGGHSKANLSGTIAPGMRAISIRSSDVAGVGGFVLPGDRVDILMTRSIGSGDSTSSVTQILAENATVLGVDQTSDLEADKPIVAKAVTVEVTPAQAQAISLGQTVGQISLSLRQIADNAPVPNKATTVADFGFRPQGAVKAAPRAKPRPTGLSEVRVVRGVESTAYSVGGY